MRVSLVTPTSDRPAAFALAERWMARQTRPADEWIVADDGRAPTLLRAGQRHVYQPRSAEVSGARSLAMNLRRALAAATGDVIVVIEDDDYYAPTHLAQLLETLRPSALLAGDGQQRYYHLPSRRWRVFQNRGASLCQTAFRREILPLVDAVIAECLATGQFGIDGLLWSRVARERWALAPMQTVVGMKGLPGRVGLGVGHRPAGPWQVDPDGRVLEAWIGADADVYRTLLAGAA